MGGGPFKNAEGGSKNYECQFQFLDPPKHTLVNISWNLALSVLQFWGGINKFLDPQKHTHYQFLGRGYKKVYRPLQNLLFTNQT